MTLPNQCTLFVGLFSSNTIKLKKDQKTGDGNEVGINGHMFDLSMLLGKLRFSFRLFTTFSFAGFSNSLIISNKKFEENRQKVEFKADKKEAQVLFDERGKLCHFVDGKWKERGAGNMEILKQKETSTFILFSIYLVTLSLTNLFSSP